MKSELLQNLQKRGIIKDIINLEKLDKKLTENEKICIYAGFDLTADSLHAGHLIPIRVLQEFHKYGHKIIVIFGGATTKIGDPSGKDESRKMQTVEQIEENKKGVIESISKFIKLDNNVIFLDNNDWMSKFSYIDFLRDVGSYFSVNKMLSMESVKLRLERESHMSFIEFNYMLLQAYDFYYLYENYGCNMQIGGSEQWGNIVNGIDLIGKKSTKKEDIFGMTINLVTRSDGKKMGKSESGAVWLNADKFSPYEYYQYFRNISDSDVKKFMLLFTNLSDDQIENETKKDINEQKKMLAFEATKICHGEQDAINAINKAVSEFEKKEAVDEIYYNLTDSNVRLIDILMEKEIASSRGELKKLIRAGGVKLDNIIVDENYILRHGNYTISIGKKKIFKLFVKKP